MRSNSPPKQHSQSLDPEVQASVLGGAAAAPAIDADAEPPTLRRSAQVLPLRVAGHATSTLPPPLPHKPEPPFRLNALRARAEPLAIEPLPEVSGNGWLILLVLVGLLAASLGLTYVAHVEQTSVARGVLLVRGGPRPVIAQVSGPVSALEVVAGQSVQEGEDLLRIGAAELQAREQRDLALLALARAEKERVCASELARRDAQERALRQKRTLLEERAQLKSTALRDRRVRRYQVEDAAHDGVASQGDALAVRESERAAAEEILLIRQQIAETNLQLSELHKSYEVTEERLRHEIDAASSSLNETRSLLATTLVRAPFSGRVESLQVAQGEVVGAGSVLARIVPEGSVTSAVVFAPAKDASFLRAGLRASLELDSLPSSEFGRTPARVTRVSRDVASAEEIASALGRAADEPVLAEKRLTSGLSLLSGVMEAMVLWYGGQCVIRGEMSVGVFAGFLAIRQLLETPLRALLGLFEGAVELRGAFDRSDEVFGVEPEPIGSLDASRVRGLLELRDVGFRYGSGGAWVLRHVSLRIEPGEHVVIVGASGQGKSTLAKLLCGVLSPSEGEVLLDGRSITDYASESLGAQLGAVLQEPLILAGSVEDALRVRVPQATPAMIMRASQLAVFQPVLERMPQGLASAIAPLGANLSGGERQRLSTRAQVALMQRYVEARFGELQAIDFGSASVTFGAADSIVSTTVRSLAEVATFAASGCAALALLASHDLGLAAAVLALAAVTALVAALLSVREMRFAARNLGAAVEAQQLLYSLLHAVTTLRAFRATERMLARWTNRATAQAHQSIAMESTRLVRGTLLLAAQQAVQLMTSVWLVHQAVAGTISLGVLTTCTMLVSQVLHACLGGTQSCLAVFVLKPLVGRVDGLRRQLSVPPVRRRHRDYGHADRKVEVRNVWYRYQPTGAWVLKDYSRVFEGERQSVLQAASGAGKSTLLRLIAGLSTPEHGRVLVCGEDPTAVTGLVAYVPQQALLLNASIATNLTVLGGGDLPRALEIAELTGLGAMLSKLPMGVETLVSGAGSNLSAGQRQLIMLTAACSTLAPVLLLDEVVSQLDAQSLRRIQWDTLLAGRTVISVRHA